MGNRWRFEWKQSRQRFPSPQWHRCNLWRCCTSAVFKSQVEPRVSRCHLEQKMKMKKKEQQEQDKCSHICSYHSTRFFVVPFHFHTMCFTWTLLKKPNSESSRRRRLRNDPLLCCYLRSCWCWEEPSFFVLSVFLLLFIHELCTITGGTVSFCAAEVLVLNSLAYTISLLMNHFAHGILHWNHWNWLCINISTLRSFNKLFFYYYLFLWLLGYICFCLRNIFIFSLFHPHGPWLLVR